MKKSVVHFGLVLTCLFSLAAAAVGQMSDTEPKGPIQISPSLNPPDEAVPQEGRSAIPSPQQSGGGKSHHELKAAYEALSKQYEKQTSELNALKNSNLTLSQKNKELQEEYDWLKTTVVSKDDAKVPGWLSVVVWALVVVILTVAGAYGFLAVISTVRKEIDGVRDELKNELDAAQKQGKVASRPPAVAPAAPANPAVLNGLKDSLQRQASTITQVATKLEGIARDSQNLLAGQQRLEKGLQAASTGDVVTLRQERDSYQQRYEQSRTEIGNLQGEVNRLSKENDDLYKLNSELDEQKRTLGEARAAVERQLEALRTEANGLHTSLDDLRKQNADLEGQKREAEMQRDALDKRLSASMAEMTELNNNLKSLSQAQQTMEAWKAGLWPQSVQDDRLTAFFREAMTAAVGGSPEANWLVACLNGVRLAESHDLVQYEEILHLTGNALCRYAHAIRKDEKELHEILTQLSVAFRNSEKGKATGAYCRVPTLGAAFDTAWVKSETGATRTEKILNWCVMNGRGRVDRMASVG